MHVSVKTLHGIRTITKMAGDSDTPDTYHWNASELARQKYVDRDYLIQVLNQLKDFGIVGSKKGPNGGYFLKSEPEEITLRDIVKALEGPTVLSPCTQPEYSDCEIIDECSTQTVLAAVAGKIDGLLDKITIADIVNESETLRTNTESSRAL